MAFLGLLPRSALAAAMLFAVTANAQYTPPFEPALANSIDVIRDAQDYKLLASLFPAQRAAFDPSRARVMTQVQEQQASAYLTEVFDVQKQVYNHQSASVVQALARLGVRPVKTTSLSKAKLKLEDDQIAWAQTISSSEIVLGARVLRGIVLGSLSESSAGEAGVSKLLASYLGAGSQAGVTPQQLEDRVALFFSAGVRGVPELRHEPDFQEHRLTQLALLQAVQGIGASAAYDQLESRLRLASAGGGITGADGMAMFDVFMHLDRHFSPALLFILSHELGHIVLGHAPFDDALPCTEKQKREDDADAFAMALLVYDVPGEIEATNAALHRLGLGEASDSDDATLSYGYSHAIRYGFELSGMTGEISVGCPYRQTDARIEFLSTVRTKLVEHRADAIHAALQAVSKAPPFVHTLQDADLLSRNEKRELAAALATRCGDGTPARPRLKKPAEPAFGWIVPCSNAIPRAIVSEEVRTSLGVGTYKELASDYANHMPQSSILLDETVMEQLLTGDAPDRSE